MRCYRLDKASDFMYGSYNLAPGIGLRPLKKYRNFSFFDFSLDKSGIISNNYYY